MMWILGVAHILRLRHIDLLGEMPVEKGIINIKLAKAPLVMECNVEHSADGDGIENLVKINTRLLVKAFTNKPSFIPRNRAIGILFDVKNPFVAHYVLPRAWGNERPSVIPEEHIILGLHGLKPLRILKSLSDIAGFRDSWKDSSEAISWVGIDVDTFRSSLHVMMV